MFLNLFLYNGLPFDIISLHANSGKKKVRWLDEYMGSNYYTQINKIKLHLGKKNKNKK